MAAGRGRDVLRLGRYSAPVICDVFLAWRHELRPQHLRLLDAPERSRSALFGRRGDRDRFVLGAALLRLAAAAQLGVAAAGLRVDRRCGRCGGQHGRPVLPGAGLHASVSHAGDCVAVALTGAGPVGVDVEAVGELDYGPLLASVCTADEQPQVRTVADFYVYWTRKEAVLKATGEGLRRPMADLAVTPPDAAPRLLTLAGGPPPDFQLTDLAAAPGYRAAAAVLGKGLISFTVNDASGLLAAPR